MAKKQVKLSVGRKCELCNISIDSMRQDARFCSRTHKRIASDKKRNYAEEYQRNKLVRRAQALKYYYQAHQESKAKQLERQKTRLPLIAAYEAARRANKKQRTPKWLDREELWLVKEAYELAATRTKLFGVPWHVDHIIPLRGNLVSGLHIIDNLQVILGTENIAKHNRYEVI